MIQDIGKHKVDSVFLPDVSPERMDYVIAFDDNQVYMKKSEKKQEDALEFLTFEDLLPISYEKEAFWRLRKDAVFLMKVDGVSLFLLAPKFMTDQPMAVVRDISIFRKGKPQYISYAMITAYHLYFWYKTTNFCGACGVRLRHKKEERAMVCPICGNIIYPRISPAIIVGVVSGDEILLTKYAQGYHNYALVAGFCEVGETIEETVAREVYEETGVHVKDLVYYKSQPWASSQSLLSGFFAKLDGEKIIHIDKNELSVAKWVNRESLMEYGPDLNISLTAEMIEYFRVHPELF